MADIFETGFIYTDDLDAEVSLADLEKALTYIKNHEHLFKCASVQTFGGIMTREQVDEFNLLSTQPKHSNWFDSYVAWEMIKDAYDARPVDYYWPEPRCVG